ncbi:MAG: hydroxymethylbilane synthase [Pseudomonadota bacterium]|jgi:hydroxymethylbilane synthase
MSNTPAPKSQVTIATRGSTLALWQADHIAALLAKRGVKSEKLILKTTADRVQDRFLHEMGGKGLFIKELEEALLAGQADLAVHSLKDMPVSMAEPFQLAAILPRHAATDVIIYRKDVAARIRPRQSLSAADLWSLGALTVGTGSLRRQNILERIAPALTCVGIRGNVDTRLKRLDAGEWDAIILAEASIERLGLEELPHSRLAPEWFIPAPGQGALALETRAGDPLAEWLGAELGCKETRLAISIERDILGRLGGDCTLPFGCFVRSDRASSPQLLAHAAIFSSHTDIAEAQITAPYSGAGKFDTKAFADELLRKLAAGGAAKVLKELGLPVPSELAGLAPW